jgi:hypothetical protein
MSNDDKILQSLIAGGLIGAALGALLSKNKEDGATIGALAGAAILATYKANEQAQKTNLPMYEEIDGKLYVIQPGGEKKFIRTLEKPGKISERFKLK